MLLSLVLFSADAYLPGQTRVRSSERRAVAQRVDVAMCEAALEQATKMCDNFMEMASDECTPPSSLANLKEAIASGELPAVRAAQYELLIDQTLSFDLNEEDGTLSPSKLEAFNKDDPDVQS